MGTTEFVVAGRLPEVASDFATTEAHAGLAITVFAIGMILGAPTVPLLTPRLPRRVTLVLALALFALAHVALALTERSTVFLIGRLAAALATGTFWSVAAVVATGLVGPERSSSALGIVWGVACSPPSSACHWAPSPARSSAGADRSGRWQS
jgi:DHA1 family inner membrane transport protein